MTLESLGIYTYRSVPARRTPRPRRVGYEVACVVVAALGATLMTNPHLARTIVVCMLVLALSAVLVAMLSAVRLAVFRTTARTHDDLRCKISHELCTPLTDIVGYLELLRDGTAGPLSDEQQSMLRTVARDADRLAATVEGLLELATVDPAMIIAYLARPRSPLPNPTSVTPRANDGMLALSVAGARL